jgi:hypothetical protein
MCPAHHSRNPFVIAKASADRRNDLSVLFILDWGFRLYCRVLKTSAYKTQSSIETMYRARFDRLRDREEKLDALYTQALRGRDTNAQAWFIAAAVPRVPAVPPARSIFCYGAAYRTGTRSAIGGLRRLRCARFSRKRSGGACGLRPVPARRAAVRARGAGGAERRPPRLCTRSCRW